MFGSQMEKYGLKNQILEYSPDVKDNDFIPLIKKGASEFYPDESIEHQEQVHCWQFMQII